MAIMKDQRIAFRVTDKELEIITKKAMLAETTVSEYSRHIVKNGVIIKQDYSKLDVVAEELQKVDKHILDLAKANNADKESLKKIYERVDGIWQLLESLVSKKT